MNNNQVKQNSKTTNMNSEIISLTKKNQGTGAGGSKTNKNGKVLEEKTRDAYTSKCVVVKVLEKTTAKYKVEVVNLNGRILIRAPEGAFKRWDKMNGFSKDVQDYKNRGLHGAKNPDDAFIDMNNKVIYWIECKVQEVGGSKCEVLQSYNHKIRNLQERYPGYTINYIYILDQNFRKLCPKEISYIIEDNIKIVWNDDANFEQSLSSLLL